MTAAESSRSLSDTQPSTDIALSHEPRHRRAPVRRVVMECRSCGTAYSTYQPRCDRCSGPTEVHHDLSTAHIGSRDLHPLLRYADLLPLEDPAHLVLDGTGDTPLVHARALGRDVGLSNLYLKYEGANPSRSTKDRIASVSLAFLRERGVTAAVISSTGNSSTSYGLMAPNYPDVHLHIVCGRSFLKRLNFVDGPNVTVCEVPGSFVAAGKVAREFARQNGLTWEAGFFNPARREGLKTAYLEAFDEMPVPPSVIVQAISSGMGLHGAAKGVFEYAALGRLRSRPKIVAAQQATCAPMYCGWLDGAETLGDEHVIAEPSGIAEAILRGDARETYPYMRRIVRDSGGCFEAADVEGILTARRLVAEREGLDICNASAVALAATIALARRGWIAEDEPVLVNLTGADRPERPIAHATTYTRKQPS